MKTKMLREELLRDNPWVEMTSMVGQLCNAKCSDGRFVLKCDEEVISKLESTLDGELKLKLNIPPQPFIGNLSAKVWVLQYNPGYSEYLDEYNYLGIDEIPTAFRHKLIAHDGYTLRNALLCKQYQLGEDCAFYALDEAFNILTSGFVHNGHRACGMYLWYRRHFFPEEEIFNIPRNDSEAIKRFSDKNLFVIERFPYHSYGFTDRIPFASLPSFDFWKKVMEYGFQNEKIIIIYGNGGDTRAELTKINGYREACEKGLVLDVCSTGRGLPSLNSNSICISKELSDEMPHIFNPGVTTCGSKRLIRVGPKIQKRSCKRFPAL